MTLGCTEICEYISLYGDGEILKNTLKYNDIIEHNENCEDCKTFFNSIDILLDKITKIDTEIPANLHMEIMKSVNNEAIGHIVQAKRRPKSKYFVLLGLVSCFAVVIIGGNFFNQSKEMNVPITKTIKIVPSHSPIPDALVNEEYALIINGIGTSPDMTGYAKFVLENEDTSYFEIANKLPDIEKVMSYLLDNGVLSTVIDGSQPNSDKALISIARD